METQNQTNSSSNNKSTEEESKGSVQKNPPSSSDAPPPAAIMDTDPSLTARACGDGTCVSGKVGLKRPPPPSSFVERPFAETPSTTVEANALMTVENTRDESFALLRSNVDAADSKTCQLSIISPSPPPVVGETACAPSVVDDYKVVALVSSSPTEAFIATKTGGTLSLAAARSNGATTKNSTTLEDEPSFIQVGRVAQEEKSSVEDWELQAGIAASLGLPLPPMTSPSSTLVASPTAAAMLRSDSDSSMDAAYRIALWKEFEVILYLLFPDEMVAMENPDEAAKLDQDCGTAKQAVGDPMGMLLFFEDFGISELSDLQILVPEDPEDDEGMEYEAIWRAEAFFGIEEEDDSSEGDPATTANAAPEVAARPAGTPKATDHPLLLGGERVGLSPQGRRIAFSTICHHVQECGAESLKKTVRALMDVNDGIVEIIYTLKIIAKHAAEANGGEKSPLRWVVTRNPPPRTMVTRNPPPNPTTARSVPPMTMALKNLPAERRAERCRHPHRPRILLVSRSRRLIPIRTRRRSICFMERKMTMVLTSPSSAANTACLKEKADSSPGTMDNYRSYGMGTPPKVSTSRKLDE